MILEEHIATVLDTKRDQNKHYAIAVQVDSILENMEYPELARPLFPPNFVKMPKEGQQVSVLVPAKGAGEEDEADLGVEEFPEHIFYTGRIFDDKEGNVPSELKTNYPKRSGWWMDNGTIIYMDESQGNGEIALVLAGGQNYVRIQEQKVELAYGGKKIIFNDTEIAVVTPKASLGGENATFKAIKGTDGAGGFLYDFGVLLTAWRTAANTLAGSSGDPTAVKAYGAAVKAALDIIIPLATTWPSTKVYIES